MDKWFLGVIFLIIIASFSVIFTRVSGRKDLENLKYRKLSADDFEILE